MLVNMNKPLLFASAAVVLTLAACSTDAADTAGEQEQPRRIIPVVRVSELSRAATDIQSGAILADGQRAGFFIDDAARPARDGAAPFQNNVPLTVATGGTTFTGAALTFPLSGRAAVYACVPYNATGTSLTADNTFAVQTDQTSEVNYLASDLLVGTPADGNPVTAAAGETSREVNMLFNHQLAKVTLELSADDSYDLTGSTVRILNTLTGCTFNIQKGTVAATGRKAAITAARYKSSQTRYACSAIVVPQTVAAGTQFVAIDLQQNGAAQTQIVSLSRALDLQGGHEYRYKIIIGRGASETTEVVMTPVSARPAGTAARTNR